MANSEMSKFQEVSQSEKKLSPNNLFKVKYPQTICSCCYLELKYYFKCVYKNNNITFILF